MDLMADTGVVPSVPNLHDLMKQEFHYPFERVKEIGTPFLMLPRFVECFSYYFIIRINLILFLYQLGMMPGDVLLQDANIVVSGPPYCGNSLIEGKGISPHRTIYDIQLLQVQPPIPQA